MTPSRQTIGVVDDDPGIRTGLRRLLESQGFAVHAFESAEAFLGRPDDGCRLDCAILDLHMPGMDGLALQEHLNQMPQPLPVIFLTGHATIPATVRAVRAGAVNFLAKPVEKADLLEAVRLALVEGAKALAQHEDALHLRARHQILTDREREVFRHVIAGRLNKQIAADLGISLQTVKLHRMNLTRKLGVTSVAALVHAAAVLGIEPASDSRPET